MVQRLSITVLADNSAGPGGLLAEHGLSFLIEADGSRVFSTPARDWYCATTWPHWASPWIHSTRLC